MLDSISRERLQPSLLDRLTDDIKGIESDIGRLRSMLPQLDEAQREALAKLLDPDTTGLPHEAVLAPFAALGPLVVEHIKRLIGLEQRRQGEIRSRFVLSTERLRACVLRDLTWLLNTPNLRWRDGRAEDSQLSAVPDIAAYPLAATSVVNYGIPPLSGRTGLDPAAVAKDLEVAIRQFEPRLRADTVKVRPAPQAAAGHAIAFDIEAELWAEPVPLRLLLRTLINLEDGAASLRPAENG